MSKFKIFLALMLVGVLAFASPAIAVSNNRLQSTGAIEASSDAELPAGTWVYGISIYADAASSQMALYDSLTVAAAIGSEVDEVGEATQYDTKTIWYPKPLYFATGVSVYIETGVGIIYYGPPPE